MSVQPGNEKRKAWDTVERIFANITVEPMFLCFVLPSAMAKLTIQNLNLQKACRVNLNYNEEICDALFDQNSTTYNKSVEVLVQQTVASVNIWKNAIQNLFPVIILLFLGPWSDRNKCRKTCLLAPMIGEVFTCMGLIVCTYFFYELSIEINAIVESVPLSITGGSPAVTLGAFGFVQAISSLKSRSFRTGIIGIIVWSGLALGFGLSGILFQKIGFYGVFSICLCIYCSGIIYGVFILKEDRSKRQPRKTGVIRDFFDKKHLSDVFNLAFTTGSRSRRLKIWLTLVVLLLITGSNLGINSENYMYTRYKFKWDEVDYSLYTIFSCVVHLIGNAIGLGLFAKYWQVNDCLIGAISCICRVFGCLIFAFAPTPFWFFVGICVDFFAATTTVFCRSMASKLVANDELGKVNSLIGLSESVAPLIFVPMFSALYKVTIDVFAGTYFLVGAGAACIATLIYIFLYVQYLYEQKTDKLETNELETVKQHIKTISVLYE